MRENGLLLAALLLGVVSCRTSDNGPATPAWGDRVIPAPHEMVIKSVVSVTPNATRLDFPPQRCPQIDTAEKLLSPFAKGEAKTARLTIVARLTPGLSFKNSAPIVDRLNGMKNADQAYAIVSEPETGVIRLIANKPIGLLYAARTFAQLVRAPANPAPDAPLTFPYPNIYDWPDIADRGLYGDIPRQDAELTLFAAIKLNRMSAQSPVPDFDASGRISGLSVETAFAARAAAEGVNIVYHIPHMGRQATYAARNPAAKTYYGAAFNVRDSGFHGKSLGFCVNNPKAAEFFADWLLATADKTHSLHPKLDVFLSESEEESRCDCPLCRQRNVYLNELDCVLKAFDLVKKKYPDARLTVFLSQGSYNHDNANDKIIAALPKGVTLGYYQGQKTYLTDTKPMIPANLEAFAKNGGQLGVVPSIGANIRTYVPFTSPQFVHFRMEEFAEKGVSDLCLFAPPSPFHYEFNLMAAAEWSWNANGRSAEDFARAYAIFKGYTDVEDFAEWATRIGALNWDLAEQPTGDVNFQMLLLGYVFSPGGDFLSRLAAGRLADPLWLDTDLDEAEAAAKLAAEVKDRAVIDESDYALGMLRAYRDLKTLAALFREKDSDENRQAIATAADSLDRSANSVREALLDWHSLFREKGLYHESASLRHPDPKQFNMESRERDAIYALYRQADAVRAAMKARKIADPRPETRATVIGQWTAADFKAGRAAKTLLIGDKVPPSGGDFSLVCDYGKGFAVRVVSIKLYAKTPSGARALLAESPDRWSVVGVIGRAAHVEHRLSIPARSAGTPLEMDIALCVGAKSAAATFPDGVAPDQRLCEGVFSWRKFSH